MQEIVAVEASRDEIWSLIRDQAQRPRFLPDGWRFHGTLTERTDAVGSRMEIEAWLGPAPLHQVIELLEIGEDWIVEGPPTADNYVSTWTVAERGEVTLVQLETSFDYGGFIGEFFVKRRLRRAVREQLQRLKAVAETRQL